MTTIQKVAGGFAILFLLVWITTHVPAFNDARGYNFGLFKIDPIDDVVHLLTALAGFLSAWYSAKASRIFLLVFGILYALDAVTGLLSQLGLLDLSLLNQLITGGSVANPDLSVKNFLINGPHIVISAAMVWSGAWGFRSVR